ncbi:flagellar hook protein FlgE [Castellaniella sp.]|uniref:flagellar hook protein FlgE n=1 Tax=Castellaniella sp. TaxID=1955812 RepID=UPI002AFFD494|nr:flagellar hook protein FlgE [Castellaniella sp.]
MGFGQGLSGLNAASQNLDVIGNNIANSGTVGFKAGSATFADVYANSRVGLGVQVASVNQRFTTGVVSTTGNQFDMAIDGANGLFVVKMPGAETLYTRNGQFFADKNNLIVNAQGQQLMGYGVDDSDPLNPKPTTELKGLTVPVGNIAPKATSDLKNTLNLDATAAPIDETANPFPDTSTPPQILPGSFSNMTPITVYDSLGNSHQVQQYTVKRDPASSVNNWDVYFVIDGDTTAIESHSLKFDDAGRLDPTTATFNLEYTFPTTVPPAVAAAEDLDINVSFSGSTQFAGGFSQNFIQDGYASGEYASMSIATDGSVVANYTNGAKKTMGYVALANFNNLQGLQPVGGNAWAETASSGQPVMGQPGSNGMATLKGQAVEESNVDMSQELVNMIIAQRTYQANAQTIKTQDQIMQTLISMR